MKISNKLFRLVCVVLALSASVVSQAQVASYVFSQSNGTYTPITGGYVIGTEVNDDNSFNNLPIGFQFCFNGVFYNNLSIQNNGFIAFGSTVVSSYTNISTGTSNNSVHVANFDLQSQNTGGELRYQTIGVAPNRTFVMQYKDYRGYLSVGDNLNFQIRLNEGTNVVSCVYGSCVMGATSRTAQVGLRGNSAADFNNRVVTTGTNTWATSTPGGANTASCDLQTANVPASGLTFVWTPPAAPAAATSLTFTAVTSSGMTVNWVDNSTDELNFCVFRSLDNINFTQVGVVTSATTATTGNPYNLVQTGLANNTLYYYRVVAVSGTSASLPLSGSQSTLPGVLCGTMAVGPTGAYTSLTAAFAAVVTNGVSCPLIFELQPTYLSAVETFPLVVPSLGSSSVNTITVRPQIGAVALSITSNATSTLQFSGASYVTFDGRPGGVGVVRQLTIDNTVTTGNAVSYVNDASNNTLTYLNITGVTSSTTNGVVNFGNSTTSAGNSDNTITLCDLSDGVTTPNNMIYSNNATPSAFNARNIISNNTISDFFSATLASNGVFVNTVGNTMWTITGNSFYQTATRTATTSNIHTYININSAAGANYTVTNNFLGGGAINCGGTAATYTGAVATTMRIILCTAGIGANTTISGNTVRNFNLTTTSGSTLGPGIFSGINILGLGNFDITGNTIGSTTSNGSIVTSTSTSGGSLAGITSTCSGNTNITGNFIGGLTSNSSTATVSSSVIGIYLTSGRNTVVNNLVGSLSTTNSLINASSNSATAGQVTGIHSTSTHTSSFTSNTVSNLTNQYAGASTASQIRGIVTTSGINTISQNTVAALSTLVPSASVDATASAVGISQSSTTVGVAQVVSGNTIGGIVNATPTANVSVAGIYFTGGTAQTNIISGNSISAIGSTSSGSAVVNGINMIGGTNTVYNNMISLGLDPLGSPLVNAHEYNGIRKASTVANTIYYNSVLIAGTGVAVGASSTSAFRRTATGVDIVRNNIFANTRSNATSGGSHFSVNLNATTTVTEDNNDLWGNGTGYVVGIVGATPYTTFPAWKVGTGFDANSFNSNPMFTSNTNLHISNPGISVLESRAAVVATITTDYDGQSRPGPVGSINGGGTIPDIGADEFDGFPITIDVGISALVTPGSGCPNDTVRYALKNYAGVVLNLAVNPVTIVAYTTGTNPVAFPNTVVNSGTIPAGGTLNVVVSSTYNMSVAGTYTFRGYTQMGADLLNDNDSLPITNFVVAGGTAIAGRPSICEFDSSLITVSGYTNGGSIQWQSSPDNITWSNIVGANSPTYMSTPSAQTFYRAMICGLYSSVSDTVNVNVVTPPTTVGDTVCVSGVANLSATTPFTANWYTQPSGGTLVNQGPTYAPTVSATTTYYVSAASGVANGLHQTTYAAGNGSAGNVFTIKALNTITISGFDGHTSINTGTNNWEIWYRPNDYLLTPGSHLSNAGWTQLGVATNVPNMGTGIPNPIPIALNLTIPAGQTYSFMIFCGASVAYTNGTTLGALYNANTDLEVYQGHGGTAFAGMVNQPRVFNGRIHYSSGCESGRTPVVALVNTVVASASATSISCAGGNATVTVAGSGGIAPYTGTGTFTVPAGTYSYTVTDANGCANTTTITVTEPTALSASSSATSIACNGGNATVTVVGSGGTAPYTGDGTFTQVAGTYTYTVTDANGCTTTTTITITEPTALAATSSATSIACFGGNATVTVVGSGGTSPYTGDGTFIVTAGTYSYTVTDANGCTNTTTITVTEPTALAATSSATSIACFGGNATVTVAATGGTAPYTGDGTFTEVAGTYSYTVTDANGCTFTTTITVTEPTAISTSVTTVDVLCNGGSTGSIDLTASGGTGPYTFDWNSGTYTTEDIINITAGTYTGTVTDANGCTNSGTVLITEPAVLVATLTSVGDPTSCGATDGTIDISVSGGVTAYGFLWSNAATTEDLSGIGAGAYTCTVTDANGCTTSVGANVNDPNAPTVTLTLPMDTVCVNDAMFTLAGESPIGGTFSGPGVSGGMFDPTAAGVGTHAISYTYTDISGCTGSTVDSIYVDICLDANTPVVSSTFTVYPNPNNGTFTLQLNSTSTADVMIYDVQGKLVSSQKVTSNNEIITIAESGMYMITVITADGNQTSQRVIVTE